MTATVDIASTTICLLNAEREKRDYDGSNCHASIRPEAHAGKHTCKRKRSMHAYIHPYIRTHTHARSMYTCVPGDKHGSTRHVDVYVHVEDMYTTRQTIRQHAAHTTSSSWLRCCTKRRSLQFPALSRALSASWYSSTTHSSFKGRETRCGG
eukprot:GHVU01204925.1.p1 GENE.GHVU01204925.1~~GHVU01204925.1.p1  ORF type:complete len:152 (+),score=6.66 GHVU01204925.1:189-644(+)